MRNLPTVRTPAQKTSRQTPMMTPATVKLPMRHEFGVRDRHTLSVVNEHWDCITGDPHNDHQQRSQDRLTCHDQADDQEQHRHDLIDDRVRLDALEGYSPFLDGGDDAGESTKAPALDPLENTIDVLGT
jgi:hypothetical protein